MKAEFAFALEYVDSIDGARKFYEDVMGLTPQRTHPVFVQSSEVVQAPRDLPFGKVFAIRGPAGEPVFFLEWAARRPSTEV